MEKAFLIKILFIKK